MPLPQPWLADALELLDLRQGDRCLLLGCPTITHLQAVSKLVGPKASIVVVEPDITCAERAADWQHEHLEVLACPLTTMDWPLELWTKLIPSNLRPGGRFVLDLPAENFCEPLQRAWEQLTGSTQALSLLRGPSEEAVTSALRASGMRNVEASVGTHILHLENPYALVRVVEKLGQADPIRIEDLERQLVEVLKTTDHADVVFHRTRVRGLR
jgi:hypothetical protein